MACGAAARHRRRWLAAGPPKRSTRRWWRASTATARRRHGGAGNAEPSADASPARRPAEPALILLFEKRARRGASHRKATFMARRPPCSPSACRRRLARARDGPAGALCRHAGGHAGPAAAHARRPRVAAQDHRGTRRSAPAVLRARGGRRPLRRARSARTTHGRQDGARPRTPSSRPSSARRPLKRKARRPCSRRNSASSASAVTAQVDVQRQTEALDARGASPQERFAERSEAYGYEAARGWPRWTRKTRTGTTASTSTPTRPRSSRPSCASRSSTTRERMRLSGALAMRASAACRRGKAEAQAYAGCASPMAEAGRPNTRSKAQLKTKV
jgi:hypothetical protein